MKGILGTKDKKWSLIWSWKGPERIKFFLSLFDHDKLCTNDKRAKWCNCVSLCDLCPSQNETNLHVLMDCTETRRILREIVT